MSSLNFGLWAFALTMIAYVFYWHGILYQGKRPQKATWIVWVAVDIILAVAMYMQGHPSGQMFGYVCGGGTIMVYALFWGTPGWTREDKIVLGGAGASLVLWFLASANAAIVLSLIAVTIGTWPTVKHLWHKPHDEPGTAWVFVWLGGLAGVIAAGPVHAWSIASALGPVVFFIIQTLILGLALRRYVVRAN